MGGADAILTRARADFARGEFRFVAEVLGHVVFADPDNRAARAMLADTLEQLGYAAESATWRNAYLFGAQELRQGMPKVPARPPMPRETLAALRTAQLWDVLGVRLNGPKAEGKHIVLNWSFTDTGESFVLNLENSALTYTEGALAAERRRLLHARARYPGRGDRESDDVPRSHRRRQDRIHRQPDAARRTDGPDGRIPKDVRDHRAEKGGSEAQPAATRRAVITRENG